MPPAAPEPTMTKSTTSEVLYFIWSGLPTLPINFDVKFKMGLVILRGFPCGGRWLPARIALVVIAKGRLESVFRQAADHRPADAATIAPAIGLGINQETSQRAPANRFKKLRGAGTGDEIGTRTARWSL